MKVYIVGGCVRDLYMGRKPKDFDYVVVGSTPEEMVAKGFTQVGADFPVFLHPVDGSEYALARIERKTGMGYHGFTAEFGTTVTLEQDLSRRDFTMNAMAHPVDGFDEDGIPYYTFDPSRIIDPFGGKRDLSLHYIRHVSEAFREDPVRILRAARFAARFVMAVHSDTMDFMREMVMAGEVKHLDPNRVWKEVSAGLMTGHPELFFDVLKRCDAMWDLEPYAGGCLNHCGGLSMVHLDFLKLHQRFACVAEGFGTNAKLFDKWRIPKDCKDLARTVNQQSSKVDHYLSLSHIDRVLVITGCGGLGPKRHTSSFDDFCTVYQVHTNAMRLDTNWEKHVNAIRGDREFLLYFDVSQIAQSVPKGMDVGVVVLKAQARALAEWRGEVYTGDEHICDQKTQ